MLITHTDNEKMNLLYGLSENRSLWIAFSATILITITFLVTGSMWGITFLDTISDPSEVRLAISSMSPDQRTVHAWITATLDVAYPLAFGALFIGSAYKFYKSFGRLIALPSFILVPVDLLEGVVQVLALTGTADLVDAKAVLTPLKTILVVFGITATAVGFILWFVACNRRSRH